MIFFDASCWLIFGVPSFSGGPLDIRHYSVVSTKALACVRNKSVLLSRISNPMYGLIREALEAVSAQPDSRFTRSHVLSTRRHFF